MENKKTYQYTAGGCFAVIAVIGLFNAFKSSYGIQLLNLIYPICFILIAVGLFINLKPLSAIAAGLYTAYFLFSFFDSLYYYSSRPLLLVSQVFMIIAYGMLFLTFIIKDGGKTTGVIAGVCRLLNLIAIMIFPIMGVSAKPSGLSIINAIFFAVGAIMTGLASTAQAQKPIAANKASVSNASSNIEQISKLKVLLDKGIITQEEFEAKKQQLLGL